MARLLVVHHSPTPGVRRLTDAAVAGALHDEIEGVEVEVREALAWARAEVGHETILAADGFLFVTPANFGYMSGALKHVFDSTFLQVGGALGGPEERGVTRGRPFGLLVHGRHDTEGAERSVLAFAGALGWQQAAPVLSALGAVSDAHVEAARELGGTVAALLMPV